MIKINVIINNDDWFNYIKKPSYYLKKKIDKLNLRAKELKKNVFFCTFLLSGDKQIKYLNNKFRKKNKTTDILSFPFQTKEELLKIFKKEKEIYLGDIIINLDKVENKKIKKSFNSEFDLLWIHGLVHLFGYEHEKDKDFKKMKKIEKKYYNLVND